ncbi:MAG: carbohydrate kinase family protein [Anaerolineae bacterium]|jgi:adenosine kinase|nr:carbohydrate kinase family protein [Anaerolineae bacterium]
MKIICTGSVAFDYLMSFPGYFKDHLLPDQLEQVSLSFLVDTMVRQRGGVAPNIAYNLALLGERPVVMATVGEDFEEYRAWLVEKGVDTSLVKVIPGKYTASFFANTDRCNAQIASFYTGAMADAASLSIKDVVPLDPDLVIISPNDPAAMEKYTTECQALGIAYVYDPSQQIVRMDGARMRQGVEGAHCLFANDYEFSLLAKHTGMTPDEIIEQVAFTVVTLGDKGARVYVKDTVYEIPAVPQEQLVDPTGVGDAFRAGFLRGYSLGLDWQTCGQMGSLAATYCLEQPGTQNHSFTPQAFVARYRQHFSDGGKLDALID